MFLNILRISASNVLKTFLNINVCISICTEINRKHEYGLSASCYLGRQESNIITTKKIFLKSKLSVHNTKGDAALTNISQEKNTSIILYSIQIKVFRLFLASSMLLA